MQHLNVFKSNIMSQISPFPSPLPANPKFYFKRQRKIILEISVVQIFENIS